MTIFEQDIFQGMLHTPLFFLNIDPLNLKSSIFVEELCRTLRVEVIPLLYSDTIKFLSKKKDFEIFK